MKHVLSLLMVYVLLSVQARALSGGPVFATDTSGVGVGTFAGVLLPKGGNTTSGLTASTSNSLGIFTLASPSTGLATGTFAYFDSGATYVGSITGVFDPTELTLRALVKAEFTDNFSETVTDNFGDTGAGTFSIANGYANGSVNARIDSSGGGFSGGDLAIRLTGTADLDVQAADATTGQPEGPVRSLALTVAGFKQSDTVNGAIDLTSLLDSAATTATTGASTTAN